MPPLFAYVDPTGGLPPSVWGPLVAVLAGGAAAAWALLRTLAARSWRVTRGRGELVAGLVGGGAAAGALMAAFAWQRPEPLQTAADPHGPRVLVLAFDGLDPQLLDRYLAEGRLPHFARLRNRGRYHPLATSEPPQSPVAWSTFLTGTPPCDHGVFDFVKRDPRTYLADLSTADRHGLKLPWTGDPLWDLPAIRRHGFVAHRLPMVFPPPRIANGRLLAGMGVWDIRGTEGTYAFYSTSPPEIPGARGFVLPFERVAGTLGGKLPGPYRHGGTDSAREPFELVPAADGGPATLRVQGASHRLLPDRWSDWIEVEFRLGTLGMQKVRAITRVLIHHDGPDVSLYVSPLQFDPRAPLYPLSHPRSWAAEIADDIGLYATRGMPFDTHAVNDGVLADEALLTQVEQITDESERMLFRDLPRFDAGVLFAYFLGSDVVQHMFWRGLDPRHPLYNDPVTRRHADAIPRFYERCDAILGRAAAALGDQGAVVVISDHGFAPFRRAVHLNAILRDLGWLALVEGRSESAELFADVDWSRTRAYALGLNAVYLNVAGREARGIVPAADAPRLADELAAALAAWVDPDEGERPILRMGRPPATQGGPDLVVGYARGYRASWKTALGGTPQATVEVNHQKWSGDHCIDPAEVPGVFLSSDPALDAESLAEVGAALDRYLAEPRP